MRVVFSQVHCLTYLVESVSFLPTIQLSTFYFSNSNKVVLADSLYKALLFNMIFYFFWAVKLSSTNAVYGHSVDTVASHYEEEEILECLEELEAQTIRNLLPDDDDLLSGVTDGLNYILPNGGDDMEEL